MKAIQITLLLVLLSSINCFSQGINTHKDVNKARKNYVKENYSKATEGFLNIIKNKEKYSEFDILFTSIYRSLILKKTGFMDLSYRYHENSYLKTIELIKRYNKKVGKEVVYIDIVQNKTKLAELRRIYFDLREEYSNVYHYGSIDENTINFGIINVYIPGAWQNHKESLGDALEFDNQKYYASSFFGSRIEVGPAEVNDGTTVAINITNNNYEYCNDIDYEYDIIKKNTLKNMDVIISEEYYIEDNNVKIKVLSFQVDYEGSVYKLCYALKKKNENLITFAYSGPKQYAKKHLEEFDKIVSQSEFVDYK